MLNYKKILLIILFLSLVACEKERPVVLEDACKIYYINNSEDRLISEDYQIRAKEINEKVEELLEKLSSIPEGITLKKTIPDSVKINSFNIKNKMISIDFTETYKELEGISEILRRAAVVKTLCQLDEIDKVEYTVSGQPLMYSETNPIGVMAASDFIDNTGGETTYYQTVQLQLYYTDVEGKKLFGTRHNIEFDGNISLEELIVKQLISGPLPSENLFPVIPKDTKINKIGLKDGICYVDLSEEFLNGIDGVSTEVMIYSLVDSLSELGGVTRVQLWVNGKNIEKYKETINLDQPLERKLEIIETN